MARGEIQIPPDRLSIRLGQPVLADLAEQGVAAVRDDLLARVGNDHATANEPVILTALGETAFNGAEQQAVAPRGQSGAFKIPGRSAHATGLQIIPDSVWDALDTPGVNATWSVL